MAGAAGLLHDPDDEAGFAASVLRLIDKTEREKFAQLGFDNLKNFDTDDMVAEYINLYKEAIELSRHAS